jgi:hypothetical protein
MDEVLLQKEKTNVNKSSFFENVINNKELIYPLLFYIAGLILGSFLFSEVNDSKFSDVMKSVFVVSQNEFNSIFINKFCVYFSLYVVTVLLGLCLIGFPFVNIIPLLTGIEVALKISYYYINYSAKGIGYSILMIIPETAVYIAVLIYTIKTSSSLSKRIYEITTKKSDMTEELNLKSYLKLFLLYGVIVLIISLINALATYLLNSIVSL